MKEDQKQWIDELTDLRLPALAYNKKRLERSFQRPSSGGPEIAPIIGQDPGLLLCLLQEFSASAHTSKGAPTSPTRIVGVLGAERVRVLARATPTLEERYRGPALKGLRLSYSRALHSAAFAHKLASLRGQVNGEEYAAVSLLQNLGEMALWARKPGTMNLLQGDLQRPEELDFKGLRRVGISPSELGEALARRWQLPVQMILAQRMHHSLDPNAQLPLLAASLAWTALNDWQEQETAQLMQLGADLTHLDPDMVQDQIHRTAAEMARTTFAMGLPHGTVRLSLPALPEAGSNARTTAPAAAAGSESEKRERPRIPEPAADRVSSLQTRRRNTDAKPTAGNAPPPSQLQLQLDGIMQEMRDELGLERIMFAMLTSELDKIRARFVLERTRSDIARFKVSAKKRNMFGILLHKPLALWIHPGNRDKYLPFIPEQTSGLLHASSFFVASILVEHRPIGLIYADGGDTPLNRPRFDGFKKHCHRIVRLFGGTKVAYRT